MNKRILISILFSVLLLSLHGQNNYGVEEANTKFSLKQGVLGGSDNFNYLSLDDHPDASGVPLGGIGVGNINLSPSGTFSRIGINNIHYPIKGSELSFFSLWTNVDGQTSAVRLVRDNGTRQGMKGIAHTQYKGLFPFAEINFLHNNLVVHPTIRAYSGLIPQNVKDSSLPVVWFEVDMLSDCIFRRIPVQHFR